MKARLLALMGLFAAVVARAGGEGPWSLEPVLGVSAEYTSNPLLQTSGARTETRAAALIDVPLKYDSDEWEWMLRPNGRLTNHSGYSALGSNFEHLDGAALYNDELDSASLQTELARDSSLYYLGGLINHLGVARDTANANGDWTRSLTELAQVQMDAGWQRVRYHESANLLVDYRYLSAGPTFSYLLTERNTLKFIGSYGDYQSLSGATQSTSENLQLGFVRRLTEIWSLSTTAGYSRSKNIQHTFFQFFGFIFPITERSSQNGTVYAASLSRQGEQLSLSGAVSRALQPTGFAFLSRQDSYSLSATYVVSERWECGLLTSWFRAINPQVSAGAALLNAEDVTNRYLNARFSATWHWTPQWTVSVTANYISQQYGPPTVSGKSSSVNVDVVRHFLRTQF